MLQSRVRIFLGVLIGGAVTLLSAFYILAHDVSFLAKWGIERAMPGVKLSIGNIRFVKLNELAVSGVVLRDSDTGDVLISMSGGRVRFQWQKLLQRHISELIFEELTLNVSPQFTKLFESDKAKQSKVPVQTKAGYWQVDVVRCDYGQLFVHTAGDNLDIYLYSRFFFDLRALGAGEGLSERMHEIVFWGAGISLDPNFHDQFLNIDLAHVRFTPDGVFHTRQINSISVRGGDLTIGESEQRLINSFKDRPDQSKNDDTTWTIGALDIVDIRTHVADPRPEVAGINFELTTKFANLPLGRIAEAIGSEQQTIELANVEIVSPVDPLMRILTLRSVFVKFTLAEVAHKEIKEVIIVSTTIYITQDLFTYMRQMQGATAESVQTKEPNASWVIRTFRVALGRLVLGGERVGQIGLPLEFRTIANDVSFDNLASLQLRAILDVKNESYDFAELQLSLENLRGNLRFAYPPEKSPTNLVNVLYLDQIRWRQFGATELWLAATFEESGISAELGGKLYNGYFNAGVTFSFGRDARWVGWMTGSKVDLKSVTELLAPGNVKLTSPAALRIEVDARGQKIDRVKGEIHATKPGHMEITKLDEIMRRLPIDWTALKRSSTEIALETLRNYDYTSAKASFWFIDGQGKLDLNLNGPTGRRDFEAVLQNENSEKRKWNE